MNNKIFFTALNFLTALTIVIFLVLPKNSSLKDLNLKNEVKKMEIQTQENYFNNLEKVSKNLSAFPTEVAKVKSGLPDSLSVQSLISFLQKSSLESGLILKRIDFSQISSIKENQSIVYLPISLEMSGSYSSVKNFLFGVENSARLIDIESFSFSASAQSQKEIYNFKIELRAYSYQ